MKAKYENDSLLSYCKRTIGCRACKREEVQLNSNARKVNKKMQHPIPHCMAGKVGSHTMK